MVRPVTSHDPVLGVPEGLPIEQVAPPGDAVTRKESGNPPVAVAPVTVTVTRVSPAETVGV